MALLWKATLLVGAIALYVAFQLVDRTDLGKLDNKRVIVTGASRGIGEQLAYNYARLGANIIITARSEDKLKKVVARCKELAPGTRNIDYIIADHEILNTTEAVIKVAVSKLGGLDYLVLNHLGYFRRWMWSGGQEDLDRLQAGFVLNFFSYVHLATHALPELVKTNGSIVVVSSIMGKVGCPSFAAYSAQKFALDGFFSSWRLELSMKNIPVSITYCVLGLIDTELSRGQSSNLRAYQEGKMDFANATETALDIIKGGLNKQREMYTPYFSMKTFVWSRDVFATGIEYFMKNAFESV